MTKRSAAHATFVIERNFMALPARVFNAFADRAAKASWFAGPGEWEKKRHEFDFRVGGRERLSGGPKGGTVHSFDALYQDIVPNERIIYTYDMHLDETRISLSGDGGVQASQRRHASHHHRAGRLSRRLRRCRQPRARHALAARQA
jgi:uncharacterized protein YndB with AHSA1/START domain